MSLMRDVVCCVTHAVTRNVTETQCCDEVGPTDNGRLMLENGTGFLLLEDGSFLLLE